MNKLTEDHNSQPQEDLLNASEIGRATKSARSNVTSSLRSTRSKDNPEFVAKQKSFMAKVQAAESGLSVSPPPGEQIDNSGKRKRDNNNTIQSAKKKKFSKYDSSIAGSVKDWQNDNWCWECHKEGVFICCEMCPRVFHLKCANLEKEPEEDWACSICHAIMQAENVEKRSRAMQLISVDQLCVLLKYALNRLKKMPAMDPFSRPVDQKDFPTYWDLVAHPMDFTLLEGNIKKKFYGSTEAFLSDARWIVHNSVIFNGVNSKVTSLARTLIKILKQELSEIETCPDCYENAHKKPDRWFSEACRLAHPLVWARLKGFPFWPAKAVKWKDSNVDVRFFGRHDRSWVPLKECYLLSEQMPTSLKSKNKTLETCLAEVSDHIKKLKDRFGKFQYAPHRVPFNPYDSEQIKVILPLYKGLAIMRLRPQSLSGQSGTDDETSSITSTDSSQSLSRWPRRSLKDRSNISTPDIECGTDEGSIDEEFLLKEEGSINEEFLLKEEGSINEEFLLKEEGSESEIIKEGNEIENEMVGNEVSSDRGDASNENADMNENVLPDKDEEKSLMNSHSVVESDKGNIEAMRSNLSNEVQKDASNHVKDNSDMKCEILVNSSTNELEKGNSIERLALEDSSHLSDKSKSSLESTEVTLNLDSKSFNSNFADKSICSQGTKTIMLNVIKGLNKSKATSLKAINEEPCQPERDKVVENGACDQTRMNEGVLAKGVDEDKLFDADKIVERRESNEIGNKDEDIKNLNDKLINSNTRSETIDDNATVEKSPDNSLVKAVDENIIKADGITDVLLSNDESKLVSETDSKVETSFEDREINESDIENNATNNSVNNVEASGSEMDSNLMKSSENLNEENGTECENENICEEPVSEDYFRGFLDELSLRQKVESLHEIIKKTRLETLTTETEDMESTSTVTDENEEGEESRSVRELQATPNQLASNLSLTIGELNLPASIQVRRASSSSQNTNLSEESSDAKYLPSVNIKSLLAMDESELPEKLSNPKDGNYFNRGDTETEKADDHTDTLDIQDFASKMFHGITISSKGVDSQTSTFGKRDECPLKSSKEADEKRKPNVEPQKCNERRLSFHHSNIINQSDSNLEAVKLAKNISNIATRISSNESQESLLLNNDITLSVASDASTAKRDEPKSIDTSASNRIKVEEGTCNSTPLVLSSSVSVTKSVEREKHKNSPSLDSNSQSPSISITPVDEKPNVQRFTPVSASSTPQSSTSTTPTTTMTTVISHTLSPGVSQCATNVHCSISSGSPTFQHPTFISHPLQSPGTNIRGMFIPQVPGMALGAGPRTPISSPVGLRMMANSPNIMLAGRLPGPPMIRHLPPDAGPLSCELNKHSHKLAEMMRTSLEDVLAGLVGLGTPEARIGAIQLELERTNWRHQQETIEIRHNADVMLVEMRANLEAEKQRGIEEVRRQMEQKLSVMRRQMELRMTEKLNEIKRLADIEKERAINETKKKQWCSNCGKEALFFCCWNTSYCDYPCQQTHWPQHMSVCGQNNDSGAGGGAGTGEISQEGVNGDVLRGAMPLQTTIGTNVAKNNQSPVFSDGIGGGSLSLVMPGPLVSSPLNVIGGASPLVQTFSAMNSGNMRPPIGGAQNLSALSTLSSNPNPGMGMKMPRFMPHSVIQQQPMFGGGMDPRMMMMINRGMQGPPAAAMLRGHMQTFRPRYM